jgi:hypothetical protein
MRGVLLSRGRCEADALRVPVIRSLGELPGLLIP